MASSDCEASAPPSSTHNVLEADAEEEPSRGERTTRRRKYKKRWPGKCCNGPTSIFPAALRRAKSEDIGAAKANEEEERPQQKGKGHYSKKRRSHSSQQQENAKSGVAVIVQRCDLDSSTDDTASQHTTTTAHSQRNRLATKTGGELLMKTNGGGNNNEGTQACAKDMVVTINVSGMHFQTYESTLRRFPNSLLGDVHKRRQLWNEQLQEFFLDRSSRCFEAVLHIYRSGGQVVRPVTVPVELFIDELVFYELKDDVWNNFCESEGCRIRPPEKMPKNELQRKVWDLMEHPDTSPLARFLASFSVLVIIVSTVSFCLESLEALKPTEANREWTSPFFWIEFSCCLWFSIELLVRFLASPSKTQFMKSFLNVLDFVAVAPFFVNLMFQDEKAVRHSEPHAQTSSTSFAVLRIVRLVRVFRIFKLSRHFTGLQVLGKTFQASIQEFFLLIFFMGIALVLFSSGVYFAEQGEPNSKFTSIPASFWYVLATMTTVGYGDMVPHGVYGKIVGSCCALIGVLTLALPVPIIVANFKRFYRQEIILAKMYEQNPPPKQAHAIILHSRTEEESINTALVDGKPVLRANDLV